MAKDLGTRGSNRYVEERLKLVFRVFIPIVFLVAGLALLSLRIPGWSLIFGLPITIFGVVFLLYTYDEVVSKKIIGPIDKEVVKCVVCGKPTPRLAGVDPKKTVCMDCQEKGR